MGDAAEEGGGQEASSRGCGGVVLCYIPLCVYLQVATMTIPRWRCWRVREARQGGAMERPYAVSDNGEGGKCVRLRCRGAARLWGLGAGCVETKQRRRQG